MVVLDTDILVAFLRGDGEAVSKVKSFYDSDMPVTATSITTFELFRGAYSSGEKKITDVELLIEDMDIFYFDTNSSRIVGKVYNDLKRQGKFIGILDMFIASIVIANNGILVTRNSKHFSKIKDLKMEKW